MIEINLLPGASKKRAVRNVNIDVAAIRGVYNRVDRFLAGVIGVCVIAVGAGAYLYLHQSTESAKAQDRLDLALTDSSHFTAVVTDRKHAEARRDTLLRELNLIRSIDDDRYIWPHIMDEVSRALPAYTWVTSVTFAGAPQGTANPAAMPAAVKDTGKKAKDKRLDTSIPKEVVTVRILGRTVDIQALTHFIRQLEASPYLANVQLDQSQLANEQGKDVTQFQLTMDYTRPDSSTVRRAPLVVVGQ